MNKKVFAILGLTISLIGAVILLMDENNYKHLPNFLRGTGLWVLLFGSSFPLIYFFFNKKKNN